MDRERFGNLIDTLKDFQSGLGQLWLRVCEIFLLPGTWLLSSLLDLVPAFSSAPGLQHHNGAYVALLSVLVWLAAIVLARTFLRTIHDAVDVLAGLARRFCLLAAHRLRMLRWRLRLHIDKLRRAKRAAGSGLAEEFEISDLQMAILEAQEDLPPGQVLTAVEIANNLEVRPFRAQQALDALKRLHLVEPAYGAGEKISGYILTRSGEMFLSAWGNVPQDGRIEPHF
ncbi:MAG: hypothetical protein WD448_12525 [Woeseia sp.]